MSRADRDPHRKPQGRRNERKGCARKVRYPGEIEAMLAASKADDAKVYKCPFCTGWHITRKPRGL